MLKFLENCGGLKLAPARLNLQTNLFCLERNFDRNHDLITKFVNNLNEKELKTVWNSDGESKQRKYIQTTWESNENTNFLVSSAPNQAVPAPRTSQDDLQILKGCVTTFYTREGSKIHSKAFCLV